MAGVAISSAEVGAFGTLGCLATSDGRDRWGITAKHVLTRSNVLHVNVFQPDSRTPMVSDAAKQCRYAVGMDVVAFPILTGVTTLATVLELGPWLGVREPVPGLVVMKSGYASGITRARIGQVDADSFELLPEPGMPTGYAAYAGGDSGAAWMTLDDRKLVGIHVSQSQQTGIGRAHRLDVALRALVLRIL